MMKRILLVLLCAVLAGCQSPAPNPTPSTSAAHDHSNHAGHDHSQHEGHDAHAGHQGHDAHQHESMDRGEPTSGSIYNLDAGWLNQEAKPVKLVDNQGKVVLVAMVYASCQAACPRIISDMRAIEDQASKDHPGKVKYILVSIDPKVDTPEKLKALATESKLSTSWELLQGDPDQVLELAALLGVKYRKTSEKDYAHSNIISVLNAKGEIAHQQVGLGVKPAETLKALDSLLKP